MARQESDREDLLREATALIQRAECHVPGENGPVTVGFRRDGSASFYFGADPVWQFTAAGRLRRAYAAGLLYKAENGRLVALCRERTAGRVELVRTALDADRSDEFLCSISARLSALRESLSRGSVEIVGQVPPGADVLGRTLRWLQALPAPISIASRPNAG